MHYLKPCVGDPDTSEFKQDSALLHARMGVTGVLDTLFYKIQTESAFKLVFERALYCHVPDSEVPQDLRGFANYRAKWELEEVGNIIKQLRLFDPESKPKFEKLSEGAVSRPQY